MVRKVFSGRKRVDDAASPGTFIKRGGLKLAGVSMLAIAAVLSGCGGGSGGSSSAAAKVLAHPNAGIAKLGTLKGASVAVYDLHTSAPIYTTTSDDDGSFKINLGSHPLDELYRVEVTGGMDVDFDDSATAGQTPVENKGTLQALLTGKEIAESGVSVNILTDIVARRIGDLAAINPPALVARELDEIAEGLVAVDINGDGKIDYRDLLVFDPEESAHREALNLDYDDFFLKDDSGNSIASLYHDNNQDLLNQELDALVSDHIDVKLPDASTSSLAAVSFVVQGRGTMTSAQLPIQLDSTQPSGTPRYRKGIDKTTPKFAVTAVAAANGTVTNWENCERDTSNPNVCYVTPDSSKTVVAIIQTPEVLKPKTLAVHVPKQPGRIGLVMEATQLVLTADQANPIVAEVDAALASLASDSSQTQFLGGELAKENALKINSLISRKVVAGIVRYAFSYAPAQPYDAVQNADTYTPPQSLSVDSIVSLNYDANGDGTLDPVQPKNEANSDYVPGPNPVDPAMDAVLCAEGETQKLLADGSDACVATTASPIDTVEGEDLTCDSGKVVVEALDGELFCANPAEIHSPTKVAEARAKAGLGTQFTTKAALIQTKLAKALTQKVATTPLAGELKTGDVVWLVGQGKAVYLAHKVFMVDRLDGTGVSMVTADENMQVVAENSKLALAAQACQKDVNAPECARMGGVGAAIHGKVALLGENGLEFTLNPDNAKWLTFKFKVNVDVTGTASNNFNMGLVYYEASSRGNIQITPSLNTTITADAAPFYSQLSDGSRGDAKASDKQKSGQPIIEKKIFSIDFIASIPGVNAISPVLESGLNFSIGIDAAGQAKLNVLATYKQVVAWDIDSRFTYKVFGANTNVQNFNVGSAGFGGITVRGDVSMSVGAFAKASVTLGPRKIAPELFELAAKYYPLKLEVLGKGLMSYQTDPALIAKQNGQKFCYAGALQLTVKEAAEATAKIELKTTNDTLNEVLKSIGNSKLYDKTLFSFDKIIYEVGTKAGSFKGEPPVFGAVALDAQKIGTPNLSPEYTGEYLKDGDKLDCVKPTPDTMPSDLTFTAGGFKLDQGESLYIKNYELAFQPDNNLVIYNWNGKRGSAVWATATDNKGAGFGRVRFQADGNLVLEDVLDAVPWSSGTYGIGANKLKFTSAGALEIYAGDTKLWSSAGGASAPDSFTFSNGNFRLNAGQSLVTKTHALFMQTDGNLVLYRVKDGRRDGNALWASNTSGASGAYVVFQTDGNLVVYDGNGSVRWSPNTYDKGARSLVLQRDGNLVIYNGSDSALWATGTN